jgi:Uma2 family endonuclease
MRKQNRLATRAGAAVESTHTMSSTSVTSTPGQIEYPETDGAPIAENTLQYEWIVTIKGGLDALFAADPNVFVAGDLFWYPVEGRPDIVVAPDVMVVFGRPKGFRPSYMQWVEGGIGPQVVFEILSPSNRPPKELGRKLEFYRQYGVEEYYVYDPGPLGSSFVAYARRGNELVDVTGLDGYASPRLGVTFEVSNLTDLRIVRPDGEPFVTFQQLFDHRDFERHRADREERRAEQERQRAEQERQRADHERQRAETERHRAEQAVREAQELRERLRALGHDPG